MTVMTPWCLRVILWTTSSRRWSSALGDGYHRHRIGMLLHGVLKHGIQGKLTGHMSLAQRPKKFNHETHTWTTFSTDRIWWRKNFMPHHETIYRLGLRSPKSWCWNEPSTLRHIYRRAEFSGDVSDKLHRAIFAFIRRQSPARDSKRVTIGWPS